MILAAAVFLITAAEDIALEVQRPGAFTSYFAIRDSTSGGSAWITHFQRTSGVPADDPRYVSAVEMRYRIEAGAVRLDVGVYFGRIDPKDVPRSLEGAARESVGSYRVPLHASVRVHELAAFGVEPFEVRTVPSKPEVPNPPIVENRTSAIEVVAVDEGRGMHAVRLKNVSSRSVIALHMRSPRPRGASGQGSIATLPRVLIEPGQIYTVQYSAGRTGRSTPAGLVEDPPSQLRIIVSAVVFDDGSSEGEPEIIETIRTSMHGSRLQVDRIVSGLEGLLRAASTDPAEVQALAERLPEEPSASEVDSAVARVGRIARESVVQELRQSFRMRREHLVSSLKFNERSPEQAFRSWLEWMTERYREELLALRAIER